MTLWDGKGARDVPREHVLPLVPQAYGIVERLVTNARLAHIPCVWGTLARNTITNAVARASKRMVASKEAKEPFQFRDLRRTCETLMGGELSVTKDTKAQIQSHGLSGIQDRHYDMATYLRQKREALERWGAYLAELPRDTRRKREAPEQG
jgi:hypothetical protein